MRDIDHVTGGSVVTNRPSYSESDAETRKYFRSAFKELGLCVSVDGAGNIRAAMAGREPDLAPVLTGSHIDTVKNGGRFDGLVGSVCALECVRVFRENGYVPRRNVEIIFFAEEEATNFGITLLGSKLLTGKLTPEDLKSILNDEGDSADTVIRRAGYDPSCFGGDHRFDHDHGHDHERNNDHDHSHDFCDDHDHDFDNDHEHYFDHDHSHNFDHGVLKQGDVYAMIETHVEQGPVLDKLGIPIGVVERIAGMETYRIVFKGVCGHAGTMPMPDRHDPMIGAAETIIGIKQAAETAESGTAVATVGKIAARPGAANIIAREVEFNVDIRDAYDESVERLSDVLNSLVEKTAEKYGLTVEVVRIAKSPAVALDPEVVALIHSAALDLGIGSMYINSGAVHDTAMMAGITRAGMIFVPSVGGASHCPEEETRAPDILNGANVLIETIRRLAESY